MNKERLVRRIANREEFTRLLTQMIKDLNIGKGEDLDALELERYIELKIAPRIKTELCTIEEFRKDQEVQAIKLMG